jgi:hypothetical protein
LIWFNFFGGTTVAQVPVKGVLTMKKSAPKSPAEKSTKPRSCLAILALVTEMARQLNENIAKVQLKPLAGNLVATPSSAAPADAAAA